MRRDEGDDAHATRVRRSDTSRRVFDDYALPGRHTEFRGGSQVGLWVGFATRDIIRRDEDRGNGYACVPEPHQGGISRTRSCDRPCIGWKRAQELGGTFDRHHAIGVDGLTCVEASCFRFGGQMWRDEANSFDGWPSMCDSHDFVAIQMVLRRPPSPMALDASRRINEDTIEIKQHRVALQLLHPGRASIMSAERPR